jgi:hypothetical protein
MRHHDSFFVPSTLRSKVRGIHHSFSQREKIIQPGVDPIPRGLPQVKSDIFPYVRDITRPSPGLKAPDVTAWAGASNASAGPGQPPQQIPQALQGRHPYVSTTATRLRPNAGSIREHPRPSPCRAKAKRRRKRRKRGVNPEWHLVKSTVFPVFAAVLHFFHEMTWTI